MDDYGRHADTQVIDAPLAEMPGHKEHTHIVKSVIEEMQGPYPEMYVRDNSPLLSSR